MGMLLAALLIVLPVVALVALVVGLVQRRWGLAGGAVGLLVACSLLVTWGLKADTTASSSEPTRAVQVSP